MALSTLRSRPVTGPNPKAMGRLVCCITAANVPSHSVLPGRIVFPDKFLQETPPGNEHYYPNAVFGSRGKELNRRNCERTEKVHIRLTETGKHQSVAEI